MSEVFVDVLPAANLPPGERTVVRLGREFVVIFNVGGQFYAVEDRCSHEDVPLSDGVIHGETVECLQHGAIFDLATGKDLAPPAVSPVRTYETRVEDGLLQIRKRK
jgi:3-phenylpropionate/trans-cinnamate dioxygenase ferredoxin subunit